MRSLATKASAFVLLLALAQFLISLTFPAEISAEVLRLDGYLADGLDVIYLGDSTLSYPLGEVTTGEILQDMLPQYTVGEIAHPAYNLDLYRHYLRYIMRGTHRPRAVIMPINMRSFSPEWDMRPGYQFEREKKTLALGLPLSRILSRPMQTFGLFEPRVSQEAFLDTTVYNGHTPLGTVRDFENQVDGSADQPLQGDAGFVYHDALPSADDDEALRQALIYRYMYGLRADHRQLQAMIEIAELGRANGVDVLFYITPVNYQQGQRFVGDAFPASVENSVRLVKTLLADGTGITPLDLSFDLEAFAFVDMEHLREIGKVHVAEQLAAALEPRAARAAQGGQVAPTLPLSASHTATPTATLTPTRPPSPTPSPTATRRTTTAAVTPAPAVTLSATVGTPASTPTATASPIPTPTPTSTPQEKPPGGTIVEIEYLWRSRPNGNYPVDMYRLRFQTLDENEQIAETQADLFIPYVGTETTFPILVHAPGTTGVSDRCAPLNEESLERNWGSYRSFSLAYAAQGYIVIFPNGLGFDDPDRTHPYFIAELQAHVLLDAARAVYNLADDLSVGDTRARPAKAVFFMGYSSGGHAAFAAKDWVGTYAPELSVKGIIGHGPTTNVETLLREDPVFSPYIIYAYRDFYGDEVIDVADVLNSQWVPAFDTDVLNKCVDDIFVYYSRSARVMYTPEFREILYGGKLNQTFPLFAEKLSANDTGMLNGRKTSVLILQGTGDTVVTPDSQRAFRDRLCEQGNLVTYLEYQAVPHAEIRRTSFGDTLWWMQRVAQDEILKGDCEAINLPR